ncbi:conserved hypothetical protein [Verticillium alfalfae VaMs.102]|uniref:Azaphilone pigments biosynthesis cluster protein L N-terminal domain-containing protein n=1 Tax=Verticillium alfalfae (strain VaMs.102 / ATCC MYA-4576 / FGSC 10136) TaxID=526221 RepID=C9S9R9_VERA1|nr:conserved hypothetical protein [Verticillium alfalfae VaMs.102]EEY16132.1 conserved hypothetical protein [Verticillium alfalfae VaMs.102]
MDPLSIAASTVPLLEAAGFITKSLYKLAKSYRTVEVRIVGLCEELTNLTNFLNTVDKTLRRYGTLDFALVEKELWREIDQSLVNCELSLNDLGKLVERIKRHAHTKGFAWKTRTVADLAVYDGELAAFRDKIHKSNSALQTILSTINVFVASRSLSLRSNTSQAKILTELSTLKLSIEAALRVSRLPVGGFSQHFISLPDARLCQNLWHLAEAAKQFHSAASSTASTVRADDSNASVRQLSRTGSSLAGDFPPIRRQWVEQCLRQGRCQSPEFATPVLSKARTNPEELSDQKKWTSDSPALASDSAPQVCEQRRSDEETEDEEEEEEEDDGEDCSDFDQYYISGLYELANESIKALDFANAARLLSRFLSKATASTEAGVAHKPTRTTKIQLAICHFLEGSWQKAAPLVTELARSKAGRNMVVCNLLHALAIAYLAQGKTDEALATCQQAFLGKKRLWKKQDSDEYSTEYYASLGLLHVVFDASDDPIRAEIFKRQLPADFDYHHFPDPRLFVAQHQTLLRALFLLPPGETAAPLVFEGSAEPGKRVRGSRRGGSSQDVSTIETDAIPFRGDADDELSPISPQAVKRGINRIFGRMIRRTSREALDSPGSPKPDSFHSNGLTRHRVKPANTWTNTKKLRTVLKKRRVVNPPQWRRQDSAEGESSGGESTPLQDDGAFTTTGRFFFAGDEQRGAPVFRAELADTSRPPELGCMATIPAKALEEPSWQAYNPYRKLDTSRSIRKAKSKPTLAQRSTKDADIEDSGYESAGSSSPQKLAAPEAGDIYSSTPAREKGFKKHDVPQLPQPVPFAKTGPPPSPAQPTAITWSPGLTRSREPPPSTRPTTDLWNSIFIQLKEPERTFKGPMEEYATKSTIKNFKTLDELARSYEKPRRAPDIYNQAGNGAQQRSWVQFSARYLPGANRGGSKTPIGALYPNLRRPWP